MRKYFLRLGVVLVVSAAMVAAAGAAEPAAKTAGRAASVKECRLAEAQTRAVSARLVAATVGVMPRRLHRRGRHGNEPRRLAVALAKRLTTQSLRALGEHFGGVGPGAVSNMARQVSADRRLARRLARLVRRCQSAETKNE